MIPPWFRMNELFKWIKGAMQNRYVTYGYEL